MQTIDISEDKSLRSYRAICESVRQKLYELEDKTEKPTVVLSGAQVTIMDQTIERHSQTFLYPPATCLDSVLYGCGVAQATHDRGLSYKELYDILLTEWEC